MGAEITGYNHIPTLQANITGEAVNGMFSVGEHIRDTARELAPRRTGRLQESIEVDKQSDGALVGSDVEYAPDVELGHHTRSGSWVAPEPYLTPAYEQHQGEVREEMAQAIVRALAGGVGEVLEAME